MKLNRKDIAPRTAQCVGEEGIKAENLQRIIPDYLFTEQKPMPDVIIKCWTESLEELDGFIDLVMPSPSLF